MQKSIDRDVNSIGGGAAGGDAARGADYQLLGADEPAAVLESGRQGQSNFVIVVDHASRRIPARLGDLGLPAPELQRHIAWDIGALAVARQVAAGLAANRRTILVAQHSMTNIFRGVRRDMHAAVLYNRDRRFAGLVLDALRREAELHIADNEPYFVSDATDYTIPRHGEARGLPHVEIEIRQDLLLDDGGQSEWAGRIAAALRVAERAFMEVSA